MNTNKIVIERTLKAPVAKVWSMWTTKEGIEAWWGPHGFRSVVVRLDVRAGGGFEIEMTAYSPEIVAHLKSLGMPATSVSKSDYTHVEDNALIVYSNLLDFVPGVAAYTATTRVEMSAYAGGGTRLVVTSDGMHDEQWTKMATTGWEQQIEKLSSTLA